ncbi:MAG: glutamine synthetase family protein [Mycoplasma sp.]
MNNLKNHPALNKLETHQVKYIKYIFVDLNGTTKETEVSIESFWDASDNNFQIMFDGSSVPGYGSINKSDLFLRPDLDTLGIDTLESSHLGNVAYVFCDIIKTDGKFHECCGRSLLKHTLEKLSKEGYDTVSVGFEPEFFLFDADTYESSGILKPIDKGNYFASSHLNKAEGICREIAFTMKEYNLQMEKISHEVATGQFEINYKHASALRSCDNFILFRYITKKIADRYGYIATFMPKPVAGINGSGLHCNMSLWKDGVNLFKNTQGTEITSFANKFINGILDNGRALAAITNSSVNSYNRLIKGFEAPVYLSYSKSNRSTLIRIPATTGNSARIELRNVDASCNVYLAMTAIIECGMLGLTTKTKNYEIVSDNLFDLSYDEVVKRELQFLPQSLEEAILCLEANKNFRHFFSETFLHSYCKIKMHEWSSFRSTVSKWEINKYIYN